MKTAVVLLALLLTALAWAYPARAGELAPAWAGRTCSGQVAAPDAQLYFFGFTKDDGFCATRPFLANTYGGAKDCAEKICSNCRVEDITGLYNFGSALTPLDASRGFCPGGR